MDCLVEIKSKYDRLSKSEKRVADFFIQNVQTATGKSIKEVSSFVGVSEGTIVRFARNLGYQGYRDFILHFSTGHSNNNPDTIPNYLEVSLGDSPVDIMNYVFANSIRSIENTRMVCEPESMESSIKSMSKAKRIDFFGMGACSIIAQDAQQKFLRINKTSYSFADSHIQTTVSATLSPSDVCVLLSYSGETMETLKIARLAKKRGAFVISITKYSENSISKVADANLYVSSPETEIRSAAMGSRISQLCIIDVLYTAVLSLEYDDVKGYLNTSREELSKNKQ